MKKTTLKLTLAFLLSVCTLAGCGNSGSDNKSDKKSKTETTTVAEEKTTAEEDKTEAKTDEEEKTTVKDNDSSSSSAAEGTDFKRGVVDGNVYTNEYAGIKLSVPDDWKYLDDEMINKVMNVGASVTYSSNSDAVTDLVNMTTVNDVFCMNPKTNENIIITYENINKNPLLDKDITAEDYFEIANRQFAAVPTMKYTIESGPETVKVAGQDYVRAVYTIEYLNMTYQQAFYARRIGDFINSLSITSYSTDKDITDYEQYFSAID
ncbi:MULTISPECIES: hypothetical protein [Ruminococcus]|uniref:PsbP C-terminal domain-containing protein n=1 Tax=Ruminococcus flavefaciens TaxID=1265 RepID=A0A1M7G6V8_RUMFL|nr:MULTISPECIES: hypothetical protein [Ruminococcus]MCR4794685.1 hypothetical protein [Ruminococcus sp.]SHM11818.1 hypothetical protein SAMN04487860_10191 [Ruminococcus flavefaciens]